MDKNTKNSTRKKILVLFYSFTGATAKLARFISEGAKSIENTEVIIKMVPEILPESFFNEKPDLKKIKDELNKEFDIATIEDFVEADGIAIGTPTHFGSFSAQTKAFIDSLTPAWLHGKLVNKPVSVFCSAGSMHGGEELTLFSLMIPLLNLGMLPIGIPYPIQGESSDFDAGSPYGAIFVSGKGREMSEGDKKVAKILGARLATMAYILGCTCSTCSSCHDLSASIK